MASSMLTMFIMRPRNQRRLARTLAITTPRGVVEQRFVRIGGIEQWVTIRGADRANPVLLFLHGGPGAVYSPLTPLIQSWEQAFTVVQWDQRGAGKTFGQSGKVGADSLSFDRLIRDGVELTEWLRSYLSQERIILVGSSVGSLIGTMMAQERPDLFAAYVGTDQNTGIKSSQRAHQLTLERLRAAGNTRNARGVRAVERLSEHPERLTPKETRALHKWALKATPEVPDMINDIMLPALLSSPDLTLRDIATVVSGMNFSEERLFRELMSIDLWARDRRFTLPVFVFQGDTDILTPTECAKAYFDDLQAPHKEFALIARSGHLAAFARPEQFLQELTTRVRPLVVAAQAAR